MTWPNQGLRHSILEAITDERLLVLCGAGVSLNASGGESRAGWAGMLAYGLGWCEEMGVQLPGVDGLERARRDLDAGDLLSAAEKLQRGLRRDGQWEHFITDAFSKLQLVDHDLIEAVVALNAPIATTNYDTLIERVAGQPPVTWRSRTVFQKALVNRAIGIAHLHGVWTDPETIVLGTADYGALLATEHTQALTRALFLRSSVLFVGCGAGLEDPNFSMLRRFLRETFAGSPIMHYQLVTEHEAQTGNPLLERGESIKQVVYGADFRDLPGYLSRMGQDLTGTGATASPSLGRTVQPKSQEAILRMPLLRGSASIGPTLAQLWPDLVLDMRVRPLRSLRPMPTDTMAWLEESNHSHVVVIGRAGAGKSTLLRRLAIEGATWFGDLPIFLTADECVTLEPSSVPQDSTLMIDGLDEVGDEGLRRISGFLRSVRSRRWWVSCRSEFFTRASPIRDLLNGADEILELQPLLPDQVDGFVEGYVRRTRHDQVARVFETWRQADGFVRLVTNPLNLIVSVLTASQENGQLPSAPKSRYVLYRMFYDHLVNYEAERHSLTSREERRLRQTHVRLARQIYSRRQRGQGLPSVQVETTRNAIWQGVASLLDCYNSGDRVLVRGFAHETFSEFVLAHDLVTGLTARSKASAIIDIAFNDDVNGFVREGFALFSDAEREGALTKLTQSYLASTNANPRSKEHALYYIGRLGLRYCPDILKTAYLHDQSPLARRSAALGAILYGELGIEHDYMSRLSSSQEEDLLNRSVQLVYFGDIMGDLHVSTDPGGDWSRTRRALMIRLSETDERAERLRWWDLCTVASFFRSRRDAPSEAERKVLSEIQVRLADSEEPRARAIRRLSEELMEL